MIDLRRGDCLTLMKEIGNCSIDLTVTSPPYDKIRTCYNHQFNFEGIAHQLYRVTKDGGVVVWVVGDETYAFCESLTSFKQAIYFVEQVGFKLLDTMIYHKSNYAPAYPTLRRYASTFEYMFVFSRGRPKTFNPIQVDKDVKQGVRHGKYRQTDGTLVSKDMPYDNGRSTKDAENVWTICPTKAKGAGDHPAVFPEELVANHVLTWSVEGNTVFDPMMGSGTTGVACVELNRNFIGMELDEKYFRTAEERINSTLTK